MDLTDNSLCESVKDNNESCLVNEQYYIRRLRFQLLGAEYCLISEEQVLRLFYCDFSSLYSLFDLKLFRDEEIGETKKAFVYIIFKHICECKPYLVLLRSEEHVSDADLVTDLILLDYLFSLERDY